eukprot:CAMPEP_0204442288 /NCGR_PEP_ID=MMETSP0470-20130426/86853_1 /ASSEMBLY_ACC=CAM_ASM_000385 /TAXON_ID=2969 /ORGANISM="Oxyrrhis marina" /LENGTH=153 /DNA_ID=CAMNT_0051441489 /DNA_START=125 /DNA_END=587 /DNA_ORIENTATION=-
MSCEDCAPSRSFVFSGNSKSQALGELGLALRAWYPFTIAWMDWAALNLNLARLNSWRAKRRRVRITLVLAATLAQRIAIGSQQPRDSISNHNAAPKPAAKVPSPTPLDLHGSPLTILAIQRYLALAVPHQKPSAEPLDHNHGIFVSPELPQQI